MKVLFQLVICLATVTTLVWSTCHDHAQDCQVEYGTWSDCDPCTKFKSRHINVTSPAHHDGAPCPGNLEQHESCVPTGVCPGRMPCPGQFDCANHRCIDTAMQCNGDDDCGNGNDERACSPTTAFPAVINNCIGLASVPYLDQVGSGMHLATGKLMGRSLDNRRFNGLCRDVYDGDAQKTYRLPFNVDTFHFQVTTSDDLAVKTYDSMASFTNELDKSKDTEVTAGIGFSIDNFGLDVSMSYSNKNSYKEIHAAMKDQRSHLFHLHSKVELSQFMINEADYILDSFFLKVVTQLPAQYTPKAYFDFFKQYGTHYLKSGVLGGVYEHFYVIDESSLDKNDQTVNTAAECLKVNMKASIYMVNLNGGYSGCSTSADSKVDSSSVASMAQKKVVSINGGTSAVAGRLAAADIVNNATEDISKFEAWVNSVRSNPVVLSKEVRSVCELIFASNVTDNVAKHDSCVTATQAYLAGYSRSSCKSCKNGGMPINVDQVCKCACTSGFGGDLCDFEFPAAGKAYISKVTGPTPLTSFASTNGQSTSGSMVKLLTTGNPPKSVNPPHLTHSTINTNDVLMKTKGTSVYLLSSDQGMIASMQGTIQGGYSVNEYDENLVLISSKPIDFSNVNMAFSICNVWDFDLNGNNDVVVTFQCFNMTTQQRSTNIYVIDASGSVQLKIDTPCATTDAESAKSYVSMTCDDRVVVTCPGAPGTLRVFSANGKPQQLTQLAGIDELNSVQVFNGQAWIHSKSRQIAAYDLQSWKQMYNYTGSTFGEPIDYTQVFVDFAGNVIAGQSHSSVPTFGRQNEKFVILDGTKDREVQASALFDDWNNCGSNVALNGKLFIKCHNATDDSQAKIFAYDYLM